MGGTDMGRFCMAEGGKGTPPPPASTPGMFSMTVSFTKGTIAVQVRVTGDSIKPAHLARVRRYLEMAEQDWEAESDD